MRRVLPALLVLASGAAAQPALVSEASVDQEAYAAGETITLRYTIRNEGDEDTALWGPCDSPGLTFDSLTSPGDGIFCTAEVDSTGLPARTSVTWVWRLDPDLLGVPERGGEQTITVQTNGGCGLDFRATTPCPLGATATFEAPAAESGPLRLDYDLADADSVAALQRVYRATVTDSTSRRGRAFVRWIVRATPLSETVAALGANGVVDDVYIDRVVFPDDLLVTPTRPGPTPPAVTAPAPNPTGGAAAFTVRPAQTGDVSVEVVDVLGRRVLSLHNGPLAGGVAHRFVVAAGALPAGVYLVRVTDGHARTSRRLVVAR